MKDPTQGLFQQQMQEKSVHPQYRKGYVDALLDVYSLVKFASQIEPIFSDIEPQ